MRLELYISDTRLDINDGTTVPISLKYFELNDITSRFSNFSQKFKLPRTKNNEVTLGVLGNEKSTSSIPYQKNNARLFVDGIQYFPDAYLIVQKLSTTFVECQLFSGVYDFFQRVSAKKLRSLNLASLNQTWSSSDQSAKVNATTGLISPMIQYGQMEYNNQYNTLVGVKVLAPQNPPSIFYKTVIDQIFIDAGLTKSGNVFSDTRYGLMIIPFSKNNWNYDDDFKLARKAIALTSGTQNESSPSNVTVDFPTVEYNGSEGYYNSTTSELEINEAVIATDFIHYNVKVKIHISVSGGDVELFVDNTAFANSKSITVSDGFDDYLEFDLFEASHQNVTNIPRLMPAKDGDTLRFVVDTLTGTPTVAITDGRIEFIPEVVYDHPSLIVDVSRDVLNQELSQIDIIKDFVILHGLVLKQEQSEIIAKSFNEIISNKSNAVNWTDKRDYSIRDEISYTVSGIAQENKFRFTANDEFTDDENGSGSIDVSNSLLKDTNDFYTSIFFGTGEVDDLGIENIARIPFLEKKDPDTPLPYDPLSYNLTKSSDPGLRVCLVRSKGGSEPNVSFVNRRPITDEDEVTSYKVAYFNDASQTYKMDLQDFIDENYSLIRDSLSKSKLVTRYYLLSSEDIVTFDPHKPVYDDGSYFIVNEIKNFIPDQPTQVELLKIV